MLDAFCDGMSVVAFLIIAFVVLAMLAAIRDEEETAKKEAYWNNSVPRRAGLDEQQRAFVQQQQELQQQFQNATAIAVAQAKAEVMGQLSGLSQGVPVARVVHTLRGERLSVQFSLAHRDGVHWVGIAWAIHPKPRGPFTVRLYRGSRLLHGDGATNNIFSEPLKPGRHRYVITLREPINYGTQVQSEEHTYLLPVISHEEIATQSAPEPAVRVDSQAERDRKLRAAFRAVVSRLTTVTDLKQECCKEIKSRRYDPDEEEWMLNRVDALSQAMIGNGFERYQFDEEE